MTPRMREFLTKMAEVAPGRPASLNSHDRMIAQNAIRSGYGAVYTDDRPKFIINQKGRDVLADKIK